MIGLSPCRRVAVIGLGNMGSALAEALVNEGHQVTVWNRTANKAEGLIKIGASAAGSAAEAAAAADVAVVCVSDHAATTAILQDPDVGWALNQKLLVQLSTMTADESHETARWGKAQGAAYLEGSILGLPQDITGGSATIIYAGPRDVFHANQPVLLALGGDPKLISEEIGAAVTFDRVYYAFAYGLFHAFIQGAALAHAKGFSIETYTSTVASRLPKSIWKLELFGKMIAARNHDDVSCRLDVHAAAFAETLAMCRNLKVDDGLPAAMMGNFERAKATGHGHQEITALFEVLVEGASRPRA